MYVTTPLQACRQPSVYILFCPLRSSSSEGFQFPRVTDVSRLQCFRVAPGCLDSLRFLKSTERSGALEEVPFFRLQQNKLSAALLLANHSTDLQTAPDETVVRACHGLRNSWVASAANWAAIAAFFSSFIFLTCKFCKLFIFTKAQQKRDTCNRQKNNNLINTCNRQNTMTIKSMATPVVSNNKSFCV